MQPKPTVIIGAGPMGLYLAYKLKKAGITNIVIYDPRAGEYVRPGHINNSQFWKLEAVIGKKVPIKHRGHIKDFERALFKEITELKIPTEKKEFVRFGENARKKSIIIKSPDKVEKKTILNSAGIEEEIIERTAGVEEEIECNFVFDCTGSRRTLVNTINALVSPPPFSIKPIRKNVAIKQHLIAYVHLAEKDLDRIPHTSETNHQSYFTSEQHVAAVNQMRAFGWKDFSLPQLYGAYFGKDKSCLYMECPDKLEPSAYEAWVKTVIDVTTKTTDISFSQLPPFQKYAYKPRLGTYEVNPRELQQAAYESTKYPTIIPIGDSQTEPHPTLAQGIADGMRRVDEFIRKLEIFNGEIAYFDTSEYQQTIKELMKDHKESIIDRYDWRDMHSHKMLKLAKTNYTTALTLAQGLPEEEKLSKIVEEIDARLSYHDALELRATLLITGTDTLSTSKYKTEDLVSKLLVLATSLSHAYAYLPDTFASEKEHAFRMITQTAAYLKECGNRFIKAERNDKALEAYQHALKLYSHPGINASLEKVTIQSNIVITYRKLNKHDEAITHGCAALTLAPETTEFKEIRKKLLFNILKSLQTTVQTLDVDKVSEIDSTKQQAITLLDQHSNLLEASTESELNLFFGKEPKTASSPAPCKRKQLGHQAIHSLS